MDEEKVEELNAEIAGQKLSLKSVALNTIITLLIAVGVGYTAFSMSQHQADAKEGRAEFIGALREQTAVMKEQTSAAKEQNCLLRFEQKERTQQADFCKQIAR